MPGSVPVRCPSCRREHTYTPPVYPCDCGVPVTLPLLRDGTPAQVRHRTWAGSWVAVSCPSCGVSKEWPQPEIGCGCGTLLRLPVAPQSKPQSKPQAGTQTGPQTGTQSKPQTGSQTGPSASSSPPSASPSPPPPSSPTSSSPPPSQQPRSAPHRSGPPAADAAPARPVRPPKVPPRRGSSRPAPAKPMRRTGPRPPFRPVTIRTAQDARTAAAEYLRWLGFPEVRVTEKRPSSGVDVRGAGIIAHVDPTTAPTTLREVETLWLNGLNDEVSTACFSLAGYSREARGRADALCVPLFVLDLAGMPQAVNDAADDLVRSLR